MSGDDHGAELDLDAIEARAEAATPGPWHGYYDDSARPFWGVRTDLTGDSVASQDMGEGWEEPHGVQGADAYFIAHAREDVPTLVAALRTLRSEYFTLVQQMREKDSEVRRLRALLDERDALRTSVAGLRASLGFKQGIIDDLSATVARLEADAP